MNVLLVSCFVLAGVPTVHNLQCYICEEQYPGQIPTQANDNSQCMVSEECDDTILENNGPFTTCSTAVSYDADTGKIKITKGCFGTHSKFSYEDCLDKVKETAVDYYCDTAYNKWECFYCCQGDLCNESGVAMQTGSVVMLLFGFLAAMFNLNCH